MQMNGSVRDFFDITLIPYVIANLIGCPPTINNKYLSIYKA